MAHGSREKKKKKRSLKGSQGNTEVVGKPQRHKLSATDYTERFLLFGDAETTFIRFSETRAVD